MRGRRSRRQLAQLWPRSLFLRLAQAAGDDRSRAPHSSSCPALRRSRKTRGGRTEMAAAAAWWLRCPDTGLRSNAQAPPGAGKLKRLRRPCRCPVAGWPAGSTRPGQGRRPCGLDIAGLHRVTAAEGRDPGPAASIRHRRSRPGRGIASVMVSSDRDDRADTHEFLR